MFAVREAPPILILLAILAPTSFTASINYEILEPVDTFRSRKMIEVTPFTKTMLIITSIIITEHWYGIKLTKATMTWTSVTDITTTKMMEKRMIIVMTIITKEREARRVKISRRMAIIGKGTVVISIKSTRISMTRIMILTSTNAMAVDITTKVVTIVMNKSRIMVRDVITEKSIIIEIVRIAVTPRITRIIITRIIVMAKKTFVAMETNGNIEYQISSFLYCYFS